MTYVIVKKLLAEEEALKEKEKENEKICIKAINQGQSMNDNITSILKSEYINSLDKYGDLMEADTASNSSNPHYLPILHKSHQTLVAIHVTDSPTDIQRERAIRFISSLNNHDTIKADFVSVSDGKMYEGLVWTGLKPGGVDVRGVAKATGYTQAVELYYLGGDN